jgi:lipopolysaccharide exporter
MSQVRGIARNSLWVTGSFGVSKVAQMGAQIVLARILGPQDFGVWAMVLVVTSLTNQFREAAIAQVLVQKGFENKVLTNTVYTLGINIAMMMFGVQILAGFTLSQFVSLPAVFLLTTVVATVFLIGAGAGCHGAFLMRQMRFRDLAICEVGAGFARVAGTILAAIFGCGVWSFVIGELAMTGVDAIMKRTLSQYHFSYGFKLDPTAITAVGGYIRGLLGINLAVYANTTGDNIVIGKLLGTQALGYYNMAYQLAMFPVFILSQVNRVNFSVLSQQDRDQQQHYVSQSLELYALVAAPIFGLAYLIAPWVIPLLYGISWAAAIPLFQIILSFAYARGFMAILGTALNALGHPSMNAMINWALVPLSIPAYFIGAKIAGSVGVAIAVALVMGIIATAWFWITTCRAADWPLYSLIQPIVLPTLAIISSIIATLQIPFANNLQSFLQPLITLIIYGAILSIGSGGRLPKLAFIFAQHSFNPRRRSANK